MVIDIKDDYGYITYMPADESPLKILDIGKPCIKDPQAVLKKLEEKEIYPIARIVVFKDSVLAEKRPELSFKLVAEYAKIENAKLGELESPSVSRPWLRDFSVTWLGTENHLKYGKKEVEAQIRALNDNDIHEYLLWNASNRYSPGVDYTP